MTLQRAPFERSTARWLSNVGNREADGPTLSAQRAPESMRRVRRRQCRLRLLLCLGPREVYAPIESAEERAAELVLSSSGIHAFGTATPRRTGAGLIPTYRTRRGEIVSGNGGASDGRGRAFA